MTNPADTLMTPAAAVARHIEWLEFALAAARDEETRRRGRLEQATDKNRQKRSDRLAEVTAEVRELAALVTGLKELQGRNSRSDGRGSTASGSAKATARTKVSKPETTAAGGDSKTAASARPAAAAAAKPKATRKPRQRAAAKPSAAAAKSRTATRARSSRRSTPSA